MVLFPFESPTTQTGCSGLKAKCVSLVFFFWTTILNQRQITQRVPDLKPHTVEDPFLQGPFFAPFCPPEQSAVP